MNKGGEEKIKTPSFMFYQDATGNYYRDNLILDKSMIFYFSILYLVVT